MDNNAEEIRNWWRTSIIDMKPGKIEFRGQPIEELIGNVSFSHMIWLMLRDEKPTTMQTNLLEAALVAGVDHGPQAPSIASARMAATCGVGMNNIIANGINMLGDIHGGAGEQCAELYIDIKKMKNNSASLEDNVKAAVTIWQKKYGKIISGFGHRFHKPVDPRAPRLMEITRKAAEDGTVSGEFVDIAEAVQSHVSEIVGKPIAMNIDGATAVIFCELGFPPELCRGLFCISRSIGILAHGWEQLQQGGRNKGPMPPSFLPTYETTK